MVQPFPNSRQPSSLVAMQGGLENPVLESQTIFRVIMDAMARPGKIIPISTHAKPPAPLSSLAGAVLATLADADTPLWLDKTLREQKSVSDWLTFHVGAPYAQETAEASFAVLSSGASIPSLEVFALGLQDYPDRSTTLIVQVEKLAKDGDWTLRGPGIKESEKLSVAPISPLFLSQWAQNGALFPRGVDVVFVAPEAIACLPRTTQISIDDLNSEQGVR